MTLDDVKAMDREMLTPAIVASVIGSAQQDVRVAARNEPDSLGFPVTVIGTRVKIPRRAFIQFMETGGPWFSRERRVGNA